MYATLREHASACQATCPSAEFKLTALPQVSGTVSHVVTGQGVFVIALLALALVAAVVFTALWAKPARRRDALALLDRIIPWRW